MGTNYGKNTRDYRPRESQLQGAMSAYGHASKHGAGLHMYDTREPDRPAALNVTTPEAAREYIHLLTAYLSAANEPIKIHEHNE